MMGVLVVVTVGTTGSGNWPTLCTLHPLSLLLLLQWNLDLMKCPGTREIGSLYRGFVTSRFCSRHFKRPG